MYKHKVLITVAFICLVVSASNAASIIYVDVNSPNDPGTGTSGDPFRRIQAAINYAVSGDTVVISPGIYTGSGNCNLDPNGRAITIRSTNPEDAGVVANTVIDPDGAGRGFNFHASEDANCVLSGVTIRNAYAVADHYNGAGIYCYNSSPTVRNCVIRDGYAQGSGGGLWCYYSNATIINCTITGNVADYYGGGISCSFSAPLITGCTLSGNTARFAGGGIDSGGSNPNIFNCVIVDNNAPYGGGIDCYYSGVAYVVNCTLAANSADNFGGAVFCWSEGSAIVKNSILWANSASDGSQLGLAAGSTVSVIYYCDVQGGQADVYDPCEQLVWGGGNIDSDPCFALFAPDGDPNLWDFHLQSAYGRWEPNGQSWVTDSNTSPCIDAGDLYSDWTGEPWPNGKRINMGAYGGTGQASKNGNIADLNIDGKVNFVDFAQLGNLWGSTQNTIEDLDGDGTVDLDDLDIMATNWLWEKP
jgi:hypothetical protein